MAAVLGKLPLPRAPFNHLPDRTRRSGRTTVVAFVVAHDEPTEQVTQYAP